MDVLIKLALTYFFKPNIKKCPDCDDVAELCPYNGEDIPMAKTEPCEGLIKGNK